MQNSKLADIRIATADKPLPLHSPCERFLGCQTGMSPRPSPPPPSARISAHPASRAPRILIQSDASGFEQIWKNAGSF